MCHQNLLDLYCMVAMNVLVVHELGIVDSHVWLLKSFKSYGLTSLMGQGIYGVTFASIQSEQPSAGSGY